MSPPFLIDFQAMQDHLNSREMVLAACSINRGQHAGQRLRLVARFLVEDPGDKDTIFYYVTRTFQGDKGYEDGPSPRLALSVSLFNSISLGEG